MLPQSFQEWEHCITVKCGLSLTSDYVLKRIKALQDPGDHHTKEFINRWGAAHHAQTVEWFQRAALRLKQNQP